MDVSSRSRGSLGCPSAAATLSGVSLERSSPVRRRPGCQAGRVPPRSSRLVYGGPVDGAAARVLVVLMLPPEDEQLRHQLLVRMQAAAFPAVVADHFVSPRPRV